MKKLIVCLALGIAQGIWAQDIAFKTQKSEIFKDEFKNSSIISVDDDGAGGTVAVRSYAGGVFSGERGYYFEHYDAQMKLIKDFTYELKGGYVMGVVVKDGMVHIMEFFKDKEAMAYTCSVNSANVSDFNFSKRELFRIDKDKVKVPGLFSSGVDGDYLASMMVNRDKTAFGISVDIVNKNAETHKLYVFNDKLEPIIDHTFKRDISDLKFSYEGIDVSDDGKVVYLLGRVRTPENKKKKQGGKYQYELSRITANESKTQVFETDEHFAASLKTIVKKDDIACVGFYSDRKDHRFKGVCHYSIDPVTLAIRSAKYTPFTEQFMIDKYGKNKDKELKNVSFRGLFLNDNDDIVLNAEEFYITTSHMMGPNGSSTTVTTYHYDDIISVKLDKSGNLLWARNINKRQASNGGNPFISYTSMIKGDDSFFFINTGEKIKKLKNDRIQFGQTSAKRSNLNVIRINQNGDFDFQEILDDKENDVPFMVMNGSVDKAGSVYLMGQKGKKKQLLRITI